MGDKNILLKFRKGGGPSRVSLIGFPPSGAGPSYFSSWLADLPSLFDLYGVQYPLRGGRMKSPVPKDWADFIEQTAKGIQEELPSGPNIFFGHSMGALLAFETTRHLEKLNCGPSLLVVSAMTAPQLWENKKKADRFKDLSDEALIKDLKRLGGTPEDIFQIPELLAMILPALRVDYGLLTSYNFRMEKPLKTPILVLGGSQDDLTPINDLRAWKEVAKTCDEPILFEGGHFYSQGIHREILNLLEKRFDVFDFTPGETYVF